jgi:hypothetical protein
MLLQSPGRGAPWPAQAVHDTVAAIMRDAAYHRSLKQSLWDRWWAWLGAHIAQFMNGVRERPSLRYALLSAAVIVVLVIVARIVVSRRAEKAGEAAAVAARRVIRGDPMLAAQQAAAEGRFTDAAHALYQAVLESLAGGGRLRLHRSKTSGDYARELRVAGARESAEFRRFGRLFDRIIFGRGSCDEAGYRELLTLAEPLIARERAA